MKLTNILSISTSAFVLCGTTAAWDITLNDGEETTWYPPMPTEEMLTLPLMATTTTEMTTLTTMTTMTTMPTPRPDPRADAFLIRNLWSIVVPGRDQPGAGSITIKFDVHDASTSPEEATTCEITLPADYAGSNKDYNCKDAWFTFRVDEYMGAKQLDLSLTHAYGASCADCNDPLDEPYEGQDAEGQVSITPNNVAWSGHSSSSGVYRGYAAGPIGVDAKFVVT